MAEIGLRQFAHLLGSDTMIGMAQKVGLHPPPPPISVRNFIDSLRPLQPTNIQLNISGVPHRPNNVPISGTAYSWEDPGAGSPRQATAWESRLKKVGNNFVALGTSREPRAFINAVLEFGSSYVLLVTPLNASGKGPDSPLFEFNTELHPAPPPPPPLPPPATKPQISVSSSGSGQGSVFVVTGSGFLPNKTIFIRVVDDQLVSLSLQQSSDGQGKLNARLSIPCISTLGLHFTATDGRPDPGTVLNQLESNTFDIPCP